ncbi:MAG: hypothetical protein K6T85_10005 [Gorillibacterium sp.]|nr:hypothetical protein [Gorillibacterium sp.]
MDSSKNSANMCAEEVALPGEQDARNKLQIKQPETSGVTNLNQEDENSFWETLLNWDAMLRELAILEPYW